MSEYTDRITSEHADKPNYMAVVAAITGDFSGTRDELLDFVALFDLDQAMGVQLDVIGEWVGIGRGVSVPIPSVYFSFDIVGLGFDQGVWKGPFDPDSGITLLPDDIYRILIRAKIGANRWDGSMAGWKAVIDQVFNSTPPQPVTAVSEPFGTTDGVTASFQLQNGGRPIYSITDAALFRTDWQGLQSMYATPRTNLSPNSQTIGGTGWVNSGITVVSTTATAPDGTATATTMSSSAPGVTSFSQSALKTVVASTDYCESVYIKAGTATASRVRIYNAAVSVIVASVGINWNTGVPSIGAISGVTGTPQLTALTGGWYRLSFAFNSGANTTLRTLVYPDVNNSVVTSTSSTWGDQTETGLVATPYIATSGSAVTTTDYTLSSTGLVGVANLTAGAALTWSGHGFQSPPGVTYVFVQDNADMTMTVVVAGAPPSVLFLALLTGGYLPLKPEAIGVAYYLVTSLPGPAFGFDSSDQHISGFDVGSWATSI